MSHLAVGHSLLGQVIVEDNGVLAVVTEVLSNRGAGVGREELQQRGQGAKRSERGSCRRKNNVLMFREQCSNTMTKIERPCEATC